MQRFRRFRSVVLVWGAVAAARPAASAEVALEHVWTHAGGGPACAEIVAYDEAARELLVGNGAERCVVRLDVATGREVGRLDVAALGDPTSVAASHGLVAVAVAAPRKSDPGHVVLFRSAGDGKSKQASSNPVAIIRVGALPDMVTLTPDGRYVLAACEGEPSDDYRTDPEGSVAVIDVSLGPERAVALLADFVRFNFDRGSLEHQGVRISGPNPWADDGRASVAQDVEPEYIAVAPDSRTAWVTLQENNALAIVDIPTAQVRRVVGLGLKDHSQSGQGLDANDLDGVARIRRQRVFGMYQPDSIAAYAVDGETFLVTANEGDARGYGDFTDEVLVSELTLDPAFDVGDELGQLKVSAVGGDTDSDGDIDQLLAFGGRSLAIWDADGKLVYDSGDALEQFIAKHLPERFNIDSDGEGLVDSRSDDKGPEPEGVVVGRIGDRVFAFVGLERTSAIAVFDVTRPQSAELLDVVPLEFEKGATGGPHIAPEGLYFVPAERSPLGEPLLAVGCEVTGTTLLFRVHSVGDN
jgi:hypothetical protein